MVGSSGRFSLGKLSYGAATFSTFKKKNNLCGPNFICKVLKNKWYHAKVLLKRFHLNGHTIGFHPENQKLELNYMPP